MPCYHPITGYKSKTVNETGKRSIVFNLKDGLLSETVQIPCGQCVGCRLERSRQWALRCLHEAELHDANSFITLTYSSENLPVNGSLNKRDFQLFMKRLRKYLSPRRVSFFMCGEYGDELSRPHYHACIFGYDFPDKTLWSVRDGVSLYRSDVLEKLWPFGFSTIGDVTFDSAAYVARYCLKKLSGLAADEVKPVLVDDGSSVGVVVDLKHYERLDVDSGEIVSLLPEFTLMSRNPAIGKLWFEKFKGDLRKDFITNNGIKHSLPKYYDRLFEVEDEEFLLNLKKERKNAALKYDSDNTTDRLLIKERIKSKKVGLLTRGLENET